jgi:hypothetical protein
MQEDVGKARKDRPILSSEQESMCLILEYKKEVNMKAYRECGANDPFILHLDIVTESSTLGHLYYRLTRIGWNSGWTPEPVRETRELNTDRPVTMAKTEIGNHRAAALASVSTRNNETT